MSLDDDCGGVANSFITRCSVVSRGRVERGMDRVSRVVPLELLTNDVQDCREDNNTKTKKTNRIRVLNAMTAI